MAKIPFFGDAVHAVLPQIAKYGCKTNLTFLLPYLQNALPPRSKWWTLTAAERLRIQECWGYLLEMANLADLVIVEPLNANGKRADLVLLHQGRLYVVEIKTVWNKETREKAVHQVRGAMKTIRKKYPGRFSIEGYCLLFHNTSTLAFDPQWIPL